MQPPRDGPPSTSLTTPRSARTAWTRAVLLFVAFSASVCFPWLGASDIVSMEGIVADGARHMLRSGRWFVPHLYEEIYAYKPAMAYWLAAVPLRALGVSSYFEAASRLGCTPEFVLRFPIALTGALAGLSMLVILGRRCGPGVGLWAAMVLLTGVEAVHKTRTAQFDMPVAAGVAVAIAAACSNLAASRCGTGLWTIGYLGLTFATLSKGVPAVMSYAPGLLLAAVLTRRWRALFQPQHLLAVGLFLLLMVGYGLGAWREAGYAAFEQPLFEGRARGVAWNWLRLGATFLKPAVIAGLVLPWTVLLPWSARTAWRDALPHPERAVAVAAWGFLIGGTAMFMAVSTNESRYYLPLAAPIAILCGLLASDRAGPDPDKSRLLDLAGGACALVPGLLTIGAAAWPVFFAPTIPQRALMALVGLLALATAWPRRHHTSGPRALRQTLFGALCLVTLIVFINVPARAQKRSQRAGAEAFAAHLPPGTPVYVDMRDDNSSLVFYLERVARAYHGCASAPPPGSFLILEPGQQAKLERGCGVELEPLVRTMTGRADLELAKRR
jgi:4-amino-4-deoxy-L-arabinose transferase-like glycosyltransferase